jgi:hypothetical protein
MIFAPTKLRNLEINLAMAWTDVARAEFNLARARMSSGESASRIAKQILAGKNRRRPSLSRPDHGTK